MTAYLASIAGAYVAGIATAVGALIIAACAIWKEIR